MAHMVEMADIEAAKKATKKSVEDERWTKFLNGKPWIFVDGIDYSNDRSRLVRRLRYQAGKRGMRIRLLAVLDDSFAFIAYK